MDISRRRFLTIAGASAVAGAGVAGGVVKVTGDDEHRLEEAVPFDGTYQAGIITPSQDRLHFAAFDITTDKRDDVIALLQKWTEAARNMTAGKTVGPADGLSDVPPEDTGEALGLSPSQLTITIGFGPSFFIKNGVDRFGIVDKRPEALINLPLFPGDALDPAISDGDIAIQACSNDPQVAVHAVRNLARIAHGTAEVRWSQLGFGRTSTTSKNQSTPRNLFGFKDGTANLRLEETDKLRDWVWVQDNDESPSASWMTNGTYLVSRRIRMQIETWDRTRLGEQERVIGRNKGEGAPLTGSKENDEPDFDSKTNGEPVIDTQAHMRLAHPDFNEGAELLRRGFSFTDGVDGLGHLDAGLFFICFQRDPRKQFVPIQMKLSSNDAMNEYIKNTSSGIFACPPGTKSGDYWGQGLFT